MSEEISQREANRRACQKFHDEHPEVWELFSKFTLNRIALGYKNYAVGAIWERIRWETDGGGDGVAEFKLNDHYRAFYSRWFMEAFPEHNGFFRIRVQTSASRPARNQPAFSPQNLENEDEEGGDA